MKTTIKPNSPNLCHYGIDRLENAAELQALFDHATATLRPCDKCGATTAIIFYYYVPTDETPHHFCIRCVGEGGCMMLTPTDYAYDTEESIKNALNYVCLVWNRKPGDWFPPLPFPYQPPEALEP